MPRCKECNHKFEARFFLQKYCMENETCIAASKKKKITKVKQNIDTKLPSHADWIQLYQITFNKFIRIRDSERRCACCDKPLGKYYDAGHAYSVKMYPNLRFDEDNVHAQRKDCNSKDDQSEYQDNLYLRIGNHADQMLKERKNSVLKISIPEIQERIIYYKNLIKIMQK